MPTIRPDDTPTAPRPDRRDAADRARADSALTRQRITLIAVTALILAALVVLGDRAGRPSPVTPVAPVAPVATPPPTTGSDEDPSSPTPAEPRPGDGMPVVDGPLMSEISTSNPGDLFDADGDAPDWIELHNPTGAPVELTGWSLSDDPTRPARWTFPAVTLDPDERLVVFASGKDRHDPFGELHTSFRLNRTDAEVLLTDADGRIIDHAIPGPLPRGASWGRHPDDPTRTCWFAFPNPGGPNSPGCFDDERLGAPVFSSPSGAYPEPFELIITADPPGTTIYYTLDGSWPDPDGDPEHTLVVDGPIPVVDRTPEPERLALIDTTTPDGILEADWARSPPEPITPIDKATVVRARTEHGIDTTATYFIGHDPSPGGLPVISLTLDEEFLVDHHTGIYIAGQAFEEWAASDAFDPDAPWWWHGANYFGRGREWQRPALGDHHRAAVIEICEPDLTCGPQHRIGVRIHGQISRILAQKGLRLYADDDPWAPAFDAAFLADRGPAGHRRLLLRAAGNDRGPLMTDGYLQSLMGNLTAETQAYRPAAVSLNGEYWGIHNLRERYDQHYLATVHGADPDRIAILDQAFGRHGVQRGAESDLDAFTNLQRAIADLDPDEPGLTDRLEALVEPALDLDSFIDFVIAHSFAANSDWPANNTRVWRHIPEPSGDGPSGDGPSGDGPLDGRWRWMIFDLDNAGGELAGSFDVGYDVFTHRMTPTDDPTVESGYPAMFHRMMQHPDWRNRFLNRFADLLATDFAADRTIAELDRLEALLAPEMARHIDRWRTHDDVEQWRSMVEAMRRFMRDRPDQQLRHLEELFDLSPAVTVTVSATGGGSVELNTVAVSGRTELTGRYWAEVPVTVTARPDDDHRFVRWDGAPPDDPTAPTLTLDPTDGLELIAVFEPR